MTDLTYSVEARLINALGRRYVRSSSHSTLEDAERRMRAWISEPSAEYVELRAYARSGFRTVLKSWSKGEAGNGRIARQSVLSTSVSCDENTPPAGDIAGH